jgi:Ca2+:H+ antiporter
MISKLLTARKVLLFVYVLYLLFQLKSHAYMYESTPQHLIDEESHPGVLADMLNSSSSSSDSSSSDSDSDASSSSRNTTQRIKRALRRKRRKSTSSSKEVPSVPSRARSPSIQTNNNSVTGVFLKPESPIDFSPEVIHGFNEVFSGDEADDDGERDRLEHDNAVTSRDFEHEQNRSKKRNNKAKSKKKVKRSRRCRQEKSGEERDLEKTTDIGPIESNESTRSPPQVEFISEVQEIPDAIASKRAFNLRNLSSAVKPALPKNFATNVFSQQSTPGQLLPVLGARPLSGRFNTGTVRRTTSLPEMQHGTTLTTSTPQPPPLSAQPLPHLMPTNQSKGSVDSKDIIDGPKLLSRTSAVLLLLASTGLVAACAEFLVDSIDYLVQNSGISQAFVGLIILPIVGNAAEHVTAVTMASKNKMDLAINVALGSSIQIALFVTPVIVLLGWALGTDMSLYFSLFETISLFASAFIVNFLLIDGRSNYLEGALLMAAYIIIAVAAFFYPTCNLSVESGPADASSSC